MNLKYPYFILLAFAICFCPLALVSQIDIDSEVVKIGARGEEGSGLIVASRKKTIYIISTYEFFSFEGKLSNSIRVQLNGYFASYSAKIIKHDASLNIAVLQVDLDKDFNHKSFSMGVENQLQTTQSVRIVGHEKEKAWTDNFYNRIRKVSLESSAEKMLISSNKLSTGFLGSPVFNRDYGWIGLVVDINDRNATVLKAKTIVNKLSEWEIPFNLVLPVLSNFKEQIRLLNDKISKKDSIRIELENQSIFNAVSEVEVVLYRGRKLVKKIAPMILTSGNDQFNFPLKKRLRSGKYTLNYNIGGRTVASDSIVIGKPGLEKGIFAGIIVGLAAITYFLNPRLPELPDDNIPPRGN